MGSENIKPCPFCGRRADLRRTSLVASWDIVGGWFVACEGAPVAEGLTLAAALVALAGEVG